MNKVNLKLTNTAAHACRSNELHLSHRSQAPRPADPGNPASMEGTGPSCCAQLPSPALDPGRVVLDTVAAILEGLFRDKRLHPLMLVLVLLLLPAVRVPC